MLGSRSCSKHGKGLKAGLFPWRRHFATKHLDKNKLMWEPSFERDACGVGLVGNISGKSTRYVVDDALTMLERMTHRGGVCEPCSGDGAGILTGVPDTFFRSLIAHGQFGPSLKSIPEAGDYAVAQLFLGPVCDVSSITAGRKMFENILFQHGLRVAGYRNIPVKPDGLGPTAYGQRPHSEQAMIVRPEDMSREEFEKKLFIVRQQVSKEGEARGLDDFHLCSLSPDTIVYKGQLTPALLRDYYIDLQDSTYHSHVAMVHSRFSTNTFPSWARAQPNRILAHNGEINTLRGNINAMRSREGTLATSQLSNEEMAALTPICSHEVSDSANLDRVLDLLVYSGRPLQDSVLQLVPEAWEKSQTLSSKVRAMYQYNSCLSEPWDGPALLAFTDGKTMGASLDRNGLRPSRFLVTRDGYVVISSEVGVVPRLEREDIVRSGRLGPGQMVMVDFKNQEFLENDAIKERAASRYPYEEWVKKHTTQFPHWHPGQTKETQASLAQEGSFISESALEFENQLRRDWTREVLKPAVTEHLETNLSEATARPKKADNRASVRSFSTNTGESKEATDLPADMELLLLSIVEQSSAFSEHSLYARLRAFGFTTESIDHFLLPMLTTGKEGMGSMGIDAPLAVLSRYPRPMSEYMKQLFAQVTNPPIDPIREEMVTSLRAPIGPEHNFLDRNENAARRLIIDHPMMMPSEMSALRSGAIEGWEAVPIDATFETKGGTLEGALDKICREAESLARDTTDLQPQLLVLSDRNVGPERVAVPSLLAVGAVHTHLVNKRLRQRVGLLTESGDARTVHDFCTLVGSGADAVYPYMTFELISQLIKDGYLESKSGRSFDVEEVLDNYRTAIGKGMLKVMAKMGISTLHSYKGSQIFEAVGLSPEIIQKCFPQMPSRIGGATFSALQSDLMKLHERGFNGTKAYLQSLGSWVSSQRSNLADGPQQFLSAPPRPDVPQLPSWGELSYRQGKEEHLNTPKSISKLQAATKNRSREAFQEYVDAINQQNSKCTIRGVLKFKPSTSSISLDEVEPASEIMKRFVTGAMSLGSISKEAHESLAEAMNEIGGRSNTGEGGEDPARFTPLDNGRSRNSKIKQIASGRFGVTSHYLANAQEIQIKMAQGAKPGEGGELPGHKVVQMIAKTRHTTPGVGLISPPPHHDIYSIEDLAQLIYDLKNANPTAKISVKLVSEMGVGTVAAGVSKAGADQITVSGHDGGTGAAAWTGIRHAGLPWELGVSETQQTLALNEMRDRVALQTDGQLKTGRDVVVAGLLGAEEFAFSTAPLISLGCVMMRKCHLNTCPVGIATQDPELRKKFNGAPENVINYFYLLAEDVRSYMAEMGYKSFDELIGKAGHNLEVDEEVLQATGAGQKAREIDLSRMLVPTDEVSPVAKTHSDRTRSIVPDDRISGLNKDLLNSLPWWQDGSAFSVPEPMELSFPIDNEDRSVGATVSYAVSRRFGADGLPDDSIKVNFTGDAGQSFGFTLAPGITFVVEGAANDYVGKGLSGGRIIVKPSKKAIEAGFVPEANVIIGNATLYGATKGELFVSGQAGERFGVRNSGATAVIEGVGDHGCEYMTGGKVVVLGDTGKNFAAGMSGGIAYVLDEHGEFDARCNQASVELIRKLDGQDTQELKAMIAKHVKETGSSKGQHILSDWEAYGTKFVKVFPYEYQRALKEASN